MKRTSSGAPEACSSSQDQGFPVAVHAADPEPVLGLACHGRIVFPPFRPWVRIGL